MKSKSRCLDNGPTSARPTLDICSTNGGHYYLQRYALLCLAAHCKFKPLRLDMWWLIVPAKHSKPMLIALTIPLGRGKGQEESDHQSLAVCIYVPGHNLVTIQSRRCLQSLSAKGSTVFLWITPQALYKSKPTCPFMRDLWPPHVLLMRGLWPPHVLPQ